MLMTAQTPDYPRGWVSPHYWRPELSTIHCCCFWNSHRFPRLIQISVIVLNHVSISVSSASLISLCGLWRIAEQTGRPAVPVLKMFNASRWALKGALLNRDFSIGAKGDQRCLCTRCIVALTGRSSCYGNCLWTGYKRNSAGGLPPLGTSAVNFNMSFFSDIYIFPLETLF